VACSDGYRGKVYVVDLVSGERVAVLGPAWDVRALAWSADGRRLATGTWDGTVKVWEVGGGCSGVGGGGDDGEVGAVPVAHKSGWWVDAGCWSPAADVLALGTREGTVEVVCGRTGQTMGALEGHEGRVMAVAWSPDGSRLATGADDGVVKVWDAGPGACQVTLTGVRSSWVQTLAWDASGRWVAVGGGDGSVRIWDVAGGGRLQAELRAPGGELRVSRVAWSPAGRKHDAAQRIAATFSDHSILVWTRVEAGAPAHKTGGVLWVPDERMGSGAHRGALRAAWSPDGGDIVLALADGQHVVSAVVKGIASVAA